MQKKDYRRQSTLHGLWGSLLLFALLLGLFLLSLGNAEEDLSASGLRTATRAVRRAAVTCYALEGAYPESYADLKADAALAVDESRYRVFYTPIAENLMPDITVVEIEGETK